MIVPFNMAIYDILVKQLLFSIPRYMNTEY